MRLWCLISVASTASIGNISGEYPLPVFFRRTPFQTLEPLGEVLRLLEAEFIGDFVDAPRGGQEQRFRLGESLSLNMFLRRLTGAFADQIAQIVDGEAELVSAMLDGLIIFITKPSKSLPELV